VLAEDGLSSDVRSSGVGGRPLMVIFSDAVVYVAVMYCRVGVC
jgi:hypothetical protein